MPSLFGKDRPTLVHIPYIFISSTQSNFSTHSFLLSIFYKYSSPLPTSWPKKSTIEIEEDNDVDFDIEIQPLSSQQLL